MHRSSIYALAASFSLALPLLACERSQTERTSEVSTTSAELEPVDRSRVAVPMGAVVGDAERKPAEAMDLGEIDDPAAGAPSTKPGRAQPARLNPARDRSKATPPDMSGVAPGHIWYVPGGDTPKAKRPATGEPNSAGSHDLGSGATSR